MSHYSRAKQWNKISLFTCVKQYGEYIFRKEKCSACLSWMEARYGAALQSLAVLFLSLHAAAAYSNPA